MRFSVVIPVYNQAHLIGNAIMSIINQSIDDWEIIIVDDGSEDYHQLQGVLHSFDNPKIEYIRLGENMGLVHARNVGILAAKGEWIVTQDADDLSMPDRLEKCIPYLYADVIVHGLYLNMWDNKKRVITRGYRPAGKLDTERIKKEQYLHGACIFRKELWQKKPFRMETQYSYDWMMHADWILSGAKYAFIDEGLYEYVRQENSASQRFEKTGKRAESFAKIKEILEKEYD